jgi:hypothetical protein
MPWPGCRICPARVTPSPAGKAAFLGDDPEAVQMPGALQAAVSEAAASPHWRSELDAHSTSHPDTMDTDTLIFAAMTATLIAVAVQAWRLGNEKRDIALIGLFGGLCGAGTAVSALL